MFACFHTNNDVVSAAVLLSEESEEGRESPVHSRCRLRWPHTAPHTYILPMEPRQGGSCGGARRKVGSTSLVV